MFANQYYTETIKQISRRSVEATLSVLGINNADLRRYLQKEFNKNGLGFLSDPVFELIHPWEQSEKTMADLSETLLLPSLLDALDKAGEMRFAREWFPYRHQLKAWTTLLDKKHKKSVVVTSGTGSGKTECFMVPVLNDLVTEYEHSQQDLVGVRALFVYPLNALINSQRKRMDAWTAPFNRGVRYCLFNGNTPEAKREEQGKKPNEVLSRELMRKSPAPMLVTNTTMLEYMLVRQKDAPVLEQSQGRLRWVILDEAHTYIGSQAAEMALLLRRVLHAFGVESKDVRFVATSATMGGERANQKLKCFIAHLAGIDEHQVEVVGGERQKPQKNQTGLKHIPIRDLKDIDPGISCSRARYDAQMKSDTAHKLNKVQYPARLSEISDALFGDQSKIWQTLEWIDLCSDTRVPGPVEKKPEQDALAFFPVRGHLFHHVLNGLWACANKSCSAKEGTDLAGSWPFGRVYTEHKTQCDCGGPVFELVFCNECTMPYLLAVQDTEGKFQQMYYQQVDEFSLEAGGDQAESDTEPERDNLTTDSEDENKVLIVPFEGANNISTMALDKDNKLVTNNGAKGNFQVNVLFNAIDQKCVCCQFKGYQNIFYRRSFLGSPFYLSNVMSILLDKSQQADKTSMHPYRGKRLLTFTDSRQGTARMAVKLQQDAERETIRSLIYKLTTQPAEGLLDEEIAVQRKKKQNLEIELNQLKAQPESTPTILSFIKDEIAALDKQLQQKIRYQTLSWKEAVEELSKAEDINRWMLDYYKDKDRQFFDDGTGAKKLANIMLAREFARRPKRQNSLETLGMVAVHYPALKKINKPPEQWAQLGFEKNDWPDFLKLIVDFFLRENSIIDINQDWIPWMGARIYPSNVTKPGSKEHAKRKWPRCKKSGRQNRIVRVVCAASKRNPELPKDRDLINAVLKSAWDDLTKSNILKSQLSNNLAYALDINQIAFKACTQAWVCPVTHKLIDSTLKGITPYLPVTAIQTSPDCQREKIMCKKVEITVHNIDDSQFDSNQQQQQAVRDYLYKNEGLNELRKENLWTDVSDKIVEGRRFFRAAEHSAQLPAKRLACYENAQQPWKWGSISVGFRWYP
ncbi:MAG: DEAD/DEAH box helicase [bacterium]